MILNRLYEVAQWANLLTDPSMVTTPVACVIKIGRKGDFNGIVDLREDVVIPPRSPRGKPKTKKSAGLPLSVPTRPVVWDSKAGRWKTTDPASSGAEKPAVFLADTLARVLPIDGLIPEKDQDKFRSQRKSFWGFLAYAAEQTSDPVLAVFRAFGDQLLSVTDELRKRMESAIAEHKLSPSAMCTLEWTADDANVLYRKGLQEWWRQFFEADQAKQAATERQGWCQVTGRRTSIPSSIKTKIYGLIPIGCRAEAYLVTGLGSAESFGLSGASNAMLSSGAIDGFTRALNMLIANELPSRKDKTRAGGVRSSFRIGGVQFLFWTRDMESSGLEILDASPDQIAAMLESLEKKSDAYMAVPKVQHDQFRMLALSGNSARIVVKDYLEGPLPRIQKNLLTWFNDLRIADPSREYQGQPNAAFPLWLLAAATALNSESVAPDTHSRLMRAALTGGPLPDSILAACLGRLRAEGSDGFRAARMGLIKLCLNRNQFREGKAMNETIDADTTHPAYLYGRLLRIFEEIQYSALGDVNANVVDKFYGTFSAAPALIFARLYSNSQNHLRKLRNENPGTAVNLDKRLAEVTSKLPASPPAGILSLSDQGRFALGYYHQKARTFAEIAERKADKAAKAESK